VKSRRRARSATSPMERSGRRRPEALRCRNPRVKRARISSANQQSETCHGYERTRTSSRRHAAAVAGSWTATPGAVRRDRRGQARHPGGDGVLLPARRRRVEGHLGSGLECDPNLHHGGSYSVAVGWDKFGPGTVESLRKDPTPQPCASTEATTCCESTERSRGRSMMSAPRHQAIASHLSWLDSNARWSSGTASGGSSRRAASSRAASGPFPARVENRLDRVGYDLTAAKNHRDAIRVLALNAQLFPGSAAANRRLGESVRRRR
jgi:hypothetical protein